MTREETGGITVMAKETVLSMTLVNVNDNVLDTYFIKQQK